MTDSRRLIVKRAPYPKEGLTVPFFCDECGLEAKIAPCSACGGRSFTSGPITIPPEA